MLDVQAFCLTTSQTLLPNRLPSPLWVNLLTCMLLNAHYALVLAIALSFHLTHLHPLHCLKILLPHYLKTFAQKTENFPCFLLTAQNVYYKFVSCLLPPCPNPLAPSAVSTTKLKENRLDVHNNQIELYTVTAICKIPGKTWNSKNAASVQHSLLFQKLSNFAQTMCIGKHQSREM